MMTPADIYKTLVEMSETFPKSSKISIHLIEPAGATGSFEGAAQRGSVIGMKSAWQLEDKTPTATFAPTDESVIAYMRNVAEQSAQSPSKVLVVIDLSFGASLTSVWVLRKGMCFIATAAYGSPLAPEVIVLSHFRDERLLTNKWGTFLVKSYYKASPRLASFIGRAPLARGVTRNLLVKPAVAAVRLFEARRKRN